jgi:uncharacterized protein with GYD domain
MSKYLMLTNLTEEGRRVVKDDPDRLYEINREVESMGVKIISQWALLGPYDFINIVEAPRDEVIAKLAIYLSALGTVQTTTFAAMTLEDLIAALKKTPDRAPW